MVLANKYNLPPLPIGICACTKAVECYDEQKNVLSPVHLFVHHGSQKKSKEKPEVLRGCDSGWSKRINQSNSKKGHPNVVKTIGSV